MTEQGRKGRDLTHAYDQKCQTGKMTTQKYATKKFDYTATAGKLRTASVGVTTATQMVWLTGLRAQPSHSLQQSYNEKDTQTA